MKKINSFTTIGLGNVGKIFTKIFKETLGLKLDFIIDTNINDTFLNEKILKKTPEKINSDLIIISTPDDFIESTISLLTSKHVTKKGAIFLHFSGALYIKSKENIISIHPMMSFTNYQKDLSRLSSHYFTLQSDKHDLIDLFIPIIKNISENYIIIKGGDKKFFHLSSVIINNFSTALMKSSSEILKSINISENDALNMLLPLLEDVFINLKNNQNINKSLTGPIIRSDKKTIDLHLDLLKNNNVDSEEMLYKMFLDYITKKFLLS
jgi:predicted short-subunit dehydrogenase-like oxidoreductase (DUF2520 family)